MTKRADIAEEKLYVARKIDAEKLSTKDLKLIQVFNKTIHQRFFTHFKTGNI